MIIRFALQFYELMSLSFRTESLLAQQQGNAPVITQRLEDTFMLLTASVTLLSWSPLVSFGLFAVFAGMQILDVYLLYGKLPDKKTVASVLMQYGCLFVWGEMGAFLALLLTLFLRGSVDAEIDDVSVKLGRWHRILRQVFALGLQCFVLYVLCVLVMSSVSLWAAGEFFSAGVRFVMLGVLVAYQLGLLDSNAQKAMKRFYQTIQNNIFLFYAQTMPFVFLVPGHPLPLLCYACLGAVAKLGALHSKGMLRNLFASVAGCFLSNSAFKESNGLFERDLVLSEEAMRSFPSYALLGDEDRLEPEAWKCEITQCFESEFLQNTTIEVSLNTSGKQTYTVQEAIDLVIQNYDRFAYQSTPQAIEAISSLQNGLKQCLREVEALKSPEERQHVLIISLHQILPIHEQCAEGAEPYLRKLYSKSGERSLRDCMLTQIEIGKSTVCGRLYNFLIENIEKLDQYFIGDANRSKRSRRRHDNRPGRLIAQYDQRNELLRWGGRYELDPDAWDLLENLSTVEYLKVMFLAMDLRTRIGRGEENAEQHAYNRMLFSLSTIMQSAEIHNACLDAAACTEMAVWVPKDFVYALFRQGYGAEELIDDCLAWRSVKEETLFELFSDEVESAINKMVMRKEDVRKAYGVLLRKVEDDLSVEGIDDKQLVPALLHILKECSKNFKNQDKCCQREVRCFMRKLIENERFFSYEPVRNFNTSYTTGQYFKTRLAKKDLRFALNECRKLVLSIVQDLASMGWGLLKTPLFAAKRVGRSVCNPLSSQAFNGESEKDLGTLKGPLTSPTLRSEQGANVSGAEAEKGESVPLPIS